MGRRNNRWGYFLGGIIAGVSITAFVTKNAFGNRNKTPDTTLYNSSTLLACLGLFATIFFGLPSYIGQFNYAQVPIVQSEVTSQPTLQLAEHTDLFDAYRSNHYPGFDEGKQIDHYKNVIITNATDRDAIAGVSPLYADNTLPASQESLDDYIRLRQATDTGFTFPETPDEYDSLYTTCQIFQNEMAEYDDLNKYLENGEYLTFVICAHKFTSSDYTREMNIIASTDIAYTLFFIGWEDEAEKYEEMACYLSRNIRFHVKLICANQAALELSRQ
jgi:hypothetical protein